MALSRDLTVVMSDSSLRRNNATFAGAMEATDCTVITLTRTS
jgi:hypothetical protein